MKSIYKYIFSFICFFSLYNPISGIETAKRSLADQSLLALAAVLNDMMFSTLIHVMYDLEDTINYWEKQPKNKRSYTIFRPGAQELDHIAALKRIEQIHAKALGNLHILRHTKNLSAKQYCLESLDIVSTLTNIPVLDNKPAYKNLKEKLTVAINKMGTYKKCFDAEIYAHTKPSHFARNWWKYLLGAAAISALGFTAYEYKQNILQGYNRVIEILQQQWQQRIVEPIKGIIRNISLESYEISQKSIEETAQAIKQKEIDIKNMKEAVDGKEKRFESALREYIRKTRNISKYMTDRLIERILNNDDSTLTNDVFDQIDNFPGNVLSDGGNSLKSIFFIKSPTQKKQNLSETLKINAKFNKLKFDKAECEAHNLVLEALKILYQVKQQSYLQEINTMLLAMFPAALTGYAAYKISTYAFSTLFFKKVILIPLQERILSIRKMLNRFDDGEQKQLSDEMTGHLIYWTHKLRQYIIQIPDEQQENFKQDIKELESTQLTIKQKHEVVKQMYDVYGFLKFHD